MVYHVHGIFYFTCRFSFVDIAFVMELSQSFSVTGFVLCFYLLIIRLVQSTISYCKSAIVKQ